MPAHQSVSSWIEDIPPIFSIWSSSFLTGSSNGMATRWGVVTVNSLVLCCNLIVYSSSSLLRPSNTEENCSRTDWPCLTEPTLFSKFQPSIAGLSRNGLCRFLMTYISYLLWGNPMVSQPLLLESTKIYFKFYLWCMEFKKMKRDVPTYSLTPE